MTNIEKLISSLDSSDANTLNQAVQSLIDTGKPAVKPLIKALSSKSPGVRNAAAQTLGFIRDKEAVDPLIGLLKDSDEKVPQGAARALGMIGDVRAVDPLIEALRHDNLLTREPAALALGQIGDKQAIKPLIAAIREGLPWEKSKKPPAATEFDWQVWTMKKEDSMRSQAAGSLIDIGSAAVSDLIAALEDESVHVRGFAASCLGKLGDARAKKALAKLKDDKVELVRKAASEALKNLAETP
jgi:HEAT repeat protein